MLARLAAALAVLGLVLAAAPANAVENAPPDGDAPAPRQLAAGRGPIDWQYDEPTRTAMENDMELLRLYHFAMEAKQRRRTISLATFIPGAVFTAVGFFGGLFQHAIGFYDSKTGDILLVAGVGGGLTLVGVGIGFAAIESPAEKEYKAYVKDKYHVVPILQLTPTKKGLVADLGVQF